MIDGGSFLNVMPAEAVPVEDEEDLPPLAKQAGRLVPDDAREEGRGQRGVIAPPRPTDHPPVPMMCQPILATTRHGRGPPLTAHPSSCDERVIARGRITEAACVRHN